MEALAKPRLRGWSHALGAGFAVIGTGVLVSLSRGQPAKAATMLLYGLSLVLRLVMSAVYHIGTWRPRVRAVLGGLDHANIFRFIAPSSTAIVFTPLPGYWRHPRPPTSAPSPPRPDRPDARRRRTWRRNRRGGCGAEDSVG